MAFRLLNQSCMSKRSPVLVTMCGSPTACAVSPGNGETISSGGAGVVVVVESQTPQIGCLAGCGAELSGSVSLSKLKYMCLFCVQKKQPLGLGPLIFEAFA